MIEITELNELKTEFIDALHIYTENVDIDFSSDCIHFNSFDGVVALNRLNRAKKQLIAFGINPFDVILEHHENSLKARAHD